MLEIIKQLYRVDLLTVSGLGQIAIALMTTGTNLMAILRIAAKLHPSRLAIIDDREQLSYAELWQQSESLAINLHFDCGIQYRQKIAIVCRNHGATVKALFAISRLGVNVILINPEMSAEQLLSLEERLQFDFFIYDEQLAPVFSNQLLIHKSLPAYHPSENSIDRMATTPRTRNVKLPKFKTGNIVVMTGGTTGQPKPASRKPSFFNFLPPFFALLERVYLGRYRSVYIATPIYHGFGLASLLMGVILGAKMYLTQRFDAKCSHTLIFKHKIEVVTLVPLMLQRLLQFDVTALSSLRCIISGGASLSPSLAQETITHLGSILFNLYGTSEAGFCIMATPELLAKKPESIGKPIRGVRAKIINDRDRPVEIGRVGRLCIRSTWSTSRGNCVETGDLVYQDSDGDLFLCGRVDDMIVSGGENVYPLELENVLVQHPDIDSVGVVGIPDREFGQRLKAIVKKKKNATLDHSTLLDWLKPRVARYQIPAIIEFRDELPYTSLGKLDKKSLRE